MKRVIAAVVLALVWAGSTYSIEARQDDKEKLRKKILEKVDKDIQDFQRKLMQEVKDILDKELGKSPAKEDPAKKAKKPGYLGVRVQEEGLDENERKELGLKDDEGIRLASVEEGSAADKAGLEADDVVVSINGKKVGTFDQLRENVTGLKEGDTIEVGIVRNKERKTVKAVLGARPNEPEEEE